MTLIHLLAITSATANAQDTGGAYYGGDTGDSYYGADPGDTGDSYYDADPGDTGDSYYYADPGDTDDSYYDADPGDTDDSYYGDCPVGFDYADTDYGPGCLDDTGTFQTCALGWWFDDTTYTCKDTPPPAILVPSHDGKYRLRAGDCEFWLDIGQLYAREDVIYGGSEIERYRPGGLEKEIQSLTSSKVTNEIVWKRSWLRKRKMLGTSAQDAANVELNSLISEGPGLEFNSWAQSYTTVDMGVGVSGPYCDVNATADAHISGGVFGYAKAGSDYAAAAWAAADAWGIGHGMAREFPPVHAAVSDEDDQVTIELPVGDIPYVGGVLTALGLNSLDIDFSGDGSAQFGGPKPQSENGLESGVTQWQLNMLAVTGVNAKVEGSTNANALTRAAAHHTMSLTATCKNKSKDYSSTAPGCKAVLTMPTRNRAELEVTHPDGTQTKACFEAPENNLRDSEDDGFEQLEEDWHAVLCEAKAK
jgi:hypothetical protein